MTSIFELNCCSKNAFVIEFDLVFCLPVNLEYFLYLTESVKSNEFPD